LVLSIGIVSVSVSGVCNKDWCTFTDGTVGDYDYVAGKCGRNMSHVTDLELKPDYPDTLKKN
jgi:hypothetical protein